MLKYIIPLILFIVLSIFLTIGLKLNPKEIPSPLIGKPAPFFTAPKLTSPNEALSPANMTGKVWLLNVWASWCASCKEEHPVLNELARQQSVILIGLNYKDSPDAAKQWLAEGGDPYTDSIMDQDGRIGLDYGVYGVPETFVIDKKGVVRYKQTGALTDTALNDTLLPLITQLQAE